MSHLVARKEITRLKAVNIQPVDIITSQLLHRVVKKSLSTHARTQTLEIAHVTPVSCDCDLEHLLLSAVPRTVSRPYKHTGTSGHSVAIADSPYIASFCSYR
jgi:hypothetical protein